MSSVDNDNVDEMNGELVDGYHDDIQRELDDDQIVLDDDLDDDEADDETDDDKDGEDVSSTNDGAKGKSKNFVFFGAVALLLGVGGFVFLGNLSGSGEAKPRVVAEYKDAGEETSIDHEAALNGQIEKGDDLPLENSPVGVNPISDVNSLPKPKIDSNATIVESDILVVSGAGVNNTNALSSLPDVSQSRSSEASRENIVSHEEARPLKTADYIDKPLSQDSRIAPGIAVGSIYSKLSSTENLSTTGSLVFSSAASSFSESNVPIVAAVSESSSLSGQVATSDTSKEVYAVLQSIKEELEIIKRDQKEIQAIAAKNNKAGSVVGLQENHSQSSASSSLSPRQKLIVGRDRLPGFQVVQSSSDKKMSIVRVSKSSGDNIIVLYEGELFRSSQAGLIAVKSILEGGSLVLVGNKWFIDGKMEKSKNTVRPTAPAKSIRRSSVASSLASMASSSSSSPSMIIAAKRPVTQAQQNNARYSNSAPVSAGGWALNVIYNDTYIVTSPSGDPVQVKRGDTLKDLGVVIGIDGSGNLKVGNYLISAP